MPDRAMAAQTALLKRRFRPAWGALEDAVVDRVVRDFVSGRLRAVREATRVCRSRLERLHTRHPDKPWGTFPRTLLATRQRIVQRRLATGDSWCSVDFLPREEAVFARYVGALMRGRYRYIKLAAFDCWCELKRQADAVRLKEFGLTGTPAPRSLKAVASQLEMRTMALGRERTSMPWSAAEVRIVDKWMRKYVSARKHGTGPSQPEAMDAMRRELENHGYPPRPADGYRGMFEKRLQHTAVGLSRPGREWTPDEMKAARRWARKYLKAKRSGSVFFITEAARRLQAELARKGIRRTDRGCEGMVERLVRPKPGQRWPLL
jgi:hypothetical protein